MRKQRDRLWWIAAGVFVMVGVIVAAVGLSQPTAAAFGWFAYQPLASATLAPGGDALVVSRTAVIGFMLLVIGLVAAAFLLGRHFGRPLTDR